MISKDTYKILKEIPRYPNQITLKQLDSMHLTNPLLLTQTLDNAFNGCFIAVSRRNTNDATQIRYHLTEAGQMAVEEYENRYFAAIKSTWALVFSIISVLISAAVAIFK